MDEQAGNPSIKQAVWTLLGSDEWMIQRLCRSWSGRRKMGPLALTLHMLERTLIRRTVSKGRFAVAAPKSRGTACAST